MVTRFAISYPDIRFELKSDEKAMFKLPKARDVRERVSHFFGEETADALLDVSGANNDASIKGLVGPPSIARPSTKMQYTFLNGRYIKDKILYRALMNGYEGILMPRKYPVSFLFIKVDPAAVDVNVHPTKSEVRLDNEEELALVVVDAIKKSIDNVNLIPDSY